MFYSFLFHKFFISQSPHTHTHIQAHAHTRGQSICSFLFFLLMNAAFYSVFISFGISFLFFPFFACERHLLSIPHPKHTHTHTLTHTAQSLNPSPNSFRLSACLFVSASLFISLAVSVCPRRR